MVNKNQFSIKNTKKVLHKVGKHWVVVSALLLGLAAGGTAVTTQANAAETNAAQPRTEVNMSANHSLGAENPAATDAIDGAKAKVSSVKTRIQQDSSYANVINLTKLAKTVYGSSAASNAYQNLGNLAASASDYNSLSLGSDVNNNTTPSTVFSMFDKASNDFDAIYNAQTTSNGKHYLGGITNLFSKANSYATNSALGKASNNSYNINSSSSISIPLSGSIPVGKHNLKLSGSVDPTLYFYSNVSINVPSIINNGMNISSVVNDFASTFIDENNNANVMSTIVSQAASANDNNIYNYLHNNNLLPSPSKASTYANTYINLKNNTVLSLVANAIVQDTPKQLNDYISSKSNDISDYESLKSLQDPNIYNETSSKISKAKALNRLLNPNPTQTNTQTVNNINTAKQKLREANNVTDATNALEPILDFGSTPAGVNQVINGLIADDAPTMFSSAVHNAASNVASFAGSLFATSGNSVNNYSFGPFANDSLADVTSYLSNLDNKLASANASGLGLPSNITSEANGLLHTAHEYVTKALSIDNDVTNGLKGFFGSKSTTKPAYNNLINAVAALPNDLQPTSNASSGSTEEAKLYNDYSNIASNTSDIDSAAMSHTAAYSNGSRIKRYVSDANRDATNSIVNEANSSANSMSTEMTSFTNAVNNVNNVITNITSKNPASYTNYAKALYRAQTDSLAISAESSAYANSLANSSVNSSNASQFANNADGISLSSSAQSDAKATSATATVNISGAYSYSSTFTGNSGSTATISANSGTYFTSNNSSTESYTFKSGGKSYTFNVASDYSETVNYSGASINPSEFSGIPSTAESVTAPSGDKFTSGNGYSLNSNDSTASFKLSSGSITINVSASSSVPTTTISEAVDFILSGTTSSVGTSSVSGTKGSRASVSAPSGYNLASGQSNTVPLNGSAQDVYVVKSTSSNNSSSTSSKPSSASSTSSSSASTSSSNNSSSTSSKSSSASSSSASNSSSKPSSTNSNASNSKSASTTSSEASSASSKAASIASASASTSNSIKNSSIASSKSAASSKAASEAAASASANNMPFVPSFNGNSSVASSNASVPASAVANSVSANSNSSKVASKSKVANYVTVQKELQLHTSPNFTKKNRVMTVEPGTRLDLEKTVRVRHGLVRYEVNYKGKSYFITANKKYTTHMSYALAKPSHYRYFKVGKTLQLHTSPYFTKKNGVITVKPNSEFRINKVVKAGKFVRYEVSYKGSVYFVTANKAFSANAYLQKSNFNKHGHKAVRVIKKLSEYKKVNFKKHSLIRNFRKGSVLPVKRVITIANGEMTRLQLTNGRYVTANKDFVKAIK